MVHAVDNFEYCHGKEFKVISTTIGLVGSKPSALAGPKLRERLNDLPAPLGPYPHSSIQKLRKKICPYERPKVVCSECGFTVPLLKTYLRYGPPICPKDRIDMDAEGYWGD